MPRLNSYMIVLLDYAYYSILYRYSFVVHERLGRKFAAGDEVPEGQAVDVQKPGDDGL
jgi:hypothetical protein